MDIHQVWLRDDGLPPNEQAAGYMRGWRDLAERCGMGYRVWTLDDARERLGDELVAFVLGPNGWPDGARWRLLSDCLRYDVIARLGGIYCDIDTEVVKGYADDVVLDIRDKAKGSHVWSSPRVWLANPYEHSRWCWNGMFAAGAEAEFVDRVALRARSMVEACYQRPFTRVKPVAWTGPVMIEAMLLEYADEFDRGELCRPDFLLHPTVAVVGRKGAPEPTSNTAFIVHQRWRSGGACGVAGGSGVPERLIAPAETVR